ncbi:N-acetylmuramoyl-L-alanine amidase [Planktotalea sp.]|uniref:N-acetylmuramoyl-L-alanine amidase n=1 Tax=Planktotalea sp. TaxID=2029877 RepID=UPI003D6AF148
MGLHPANRHIQLGIKSLGYDPGKIDGWFGKNTARSSLALFESGPLRQTEWAVLQLKTGLRDLGYFSGRMDGEYSGVLRKALGAMLDAEGMPLAEAVKGPEVLTPTKPLLKPVSHGARLYQGSARYEIDTICLHCLAVPSSWHASRSNKQILADVRSMHVTPRSEGGRGWRDVGYQWITCPDGEVLEGRPEDQIGAGAKGHNRGVIHINMVETRTIDRMRRPEDYFTPETLSSAKALIESYMQRAQIKRLMGHNEVASKLCPGFKVIDRDWTDRTVA